jgi:tRNA 2-thiouridine synthesizing protein D
MKFALLITAAPFSSQGAETALRFAQAAVNSGHSIERVFFFRDGVHNASRSSIAPQDEKNIPAAWQKFCETQKIDTVVCVSAALKRGISEENIFSNMQIGGLGLLTDAIINADRVLTFG